ncbi:MAG: Crp/Fnr family transcriptional regulator [Steroidobacteraceae bacterium]
MIRVSRLIRKLENFAPLSEEEKSALMDASTTIRRYGAHEDMIQEGAPTDGVKIILDGMACRYKVLPDGRRQIVAYFIPGDMCDLRLFLLKRMDHSIGTLCTVEAALLPQESVQELTERYPRLTRALWWSTLVEEAISREWLVNVGHRTAFERMAHLFCEIFLRLQSVGLTHENRCELPLTQTELADTLALSAVHVNRTLMDMRRAHLVTFQGRQLIIHDRHALQSVAGFHPNYLHLDGEANRVPTVLKRNSA